MYNSQNRHYLQFSKLNGFILDSQRRNENKLIKRQSAITLVEYKKRFITNMNIRPKNIHYIYNHIEYIFYSFVNIIFKKNSII